MIKPLPHWAVSDRQPGFYDTDSKTAIEQTARLHFKMQELIVEVNKFIDEINLEISNYEKQMNDNHEKFINTIVEKVENYIHCIDLKIHQQDKNILNKFEAQDIIINDAVDYLKINLERVVSELFYNALQNGEIKVELVTEYDDTTENLVIKLHMADNGGV